MNNKLFLFVSYFSDNIVAVVVSAIYLESKWKWGIQFEDEIYPETENYNFVRTLDPDLEKSFPKIDLREIEWIKTITENKFTGFVKYAESKNHDFDIFRLELESKGNQKLYFYALQHKKFIEGMIDFEKSGFLFLK